MINIQSFLDSNVTPVGDFNMSQKISNTQKWSVILKMDENVFLNWGKIVMVNQFFLNQINIKTLTSDKGATLSYGP